MSELNKTEKIIMSIVYGLTAISLIIISFVIYNIIAKEKPQTLGTVYISSLTCSDEDINIVEVKIHSNENGNGVSCYEVLWNGYTDYQGKAIKGFGIQSTELPKAHDYNMCPDGSFAFNYVQSPYITEFPNSTMYTTDDLGLSYYVPSGMPNELYFDIDGKMYKYQFKTFEREIYSTNGWNFFNQVFQIKTTEKVSFNYYTLFNSIVNSALTESAKEEYLEFAMNMFDLSPYVEIYYQDEDTQYKPLSKTSTMYKLFKIKITYSKDGLTDVSQSIFKQLKGNSSWDFYSNTDVKEYWNAYSSIVLTENNLNYVYDESESSYYAVIDENFAEYLSSLSYAEIIFDLDFTVLDFDVYAIDLKNFDFDVKNIDIQSNNEDFVVYNQAYCEIIPNLGVVA